MMRVISMPLLPGKPPVRISADSINLGGSWTENGVYDAKRIRAFFAKMEQYRQPVIVDVGAGTGSFALLSRFHSGATVYAFEPNPDPREVLIENALLNQVEDRVMVSPYALSDYNGYGLLRIPRTTHSGLATLGRPLRFGLFREIEVEVRCLDDLLEGPLDMMKIDTEGCELHVLKGARGLIEKHHPGIMVEVNHMNTLQFNYDKGDIQAFLEKLGYKEFTYLGREDLWAT